MTLDERSAAQFADLALACIHRKYPNKIAHVMNSRDDVAPPRRLTPAFYGCYDWHSAVHGHWLLVRLCKMFPDAQFISRARSALNQNLTAENLLQEARYLLAEGRESFERPYGLAWLLQLAVELREWTSGGKLAENIRPLENAALDRLKTWLPKLRHPVRSGEHSQTAFALGLMLDYAHCTDDSDFTEWLSRKAREFYLGDVNCPLAYEPSGEDFLSPCLAEADVMRRVSSRDEFSSWLDKFMPQIPTNGTADWIQAVVSPDPADPKLAHLDGLNLSRAWMLEGIASALENDARSHAINRAASEHALAGLAAGTGEHYVGSHWLSTFAVYLLTRRGIRG